MPNVRIPDDLYDKVQFIKGDLLLEFGSEAPVVLDMVTVALSRFIRAWGTEDNKQLLTDLLKSREQSRARMGRREGNASAPQLLANPL